VDPKRAHSPCGKRLFCAIVRSKWGNQNGNSGKKLKVQEIGCYPGKPSSEILAESGTTAPVKRPTLNQRLETEMWKCTSCGFENIDTTDKCSNCDRYNDQSQYHQQQRDIGIGNLEQHLLEMPYRDRQLICTIKPSSHSQIEFVRIFNGVAFAAFAVLAPGNAAVIAVSKIPGVSEQYEQFAHKISGRFWRAVSVIPGVSKIKNKLGEIERPFEEAAERVVEALPPRKQVDEFLNNRWESLRAYFKRRRGHFLRMPADVAEKLISFQAGHPLYDTVYAGHPLVPRIYITVASFHRYLFEEKFNELLTLLHDLGAVQVEIEHVRGYSTAITGGASFEASSLDLAASRSSRVSQSSEGRASARFLPSSTPHVSQSLVWLNYEPTWKNLGDRRLKGLTDIDIDLRYDDDFGINQDLTFKLKKQGLSLGGGFESHEQTTWKFKAKFS